jgi:hypothetical protein
MALVNRSTKVILGGLLVSYLCPTKNDAAIKITFYSKFNND